MNLKKGQIVYISGEKNVVINMIEFKEGTYLWQEYEIVSLQTNLHRWLSIEQDEYNKFEYYVYEKYFGIVNQNDIELFIDQKKYKLYESGNAFVKSYFGNADVDINEQCNFFDYICDEDNSIISIELWEGEKEQSIGYKIQNEDIKISEEFDESITNKKDNESKKSAVIFIAIFVALFCISPLMALFSGIFVNKSIQKYIDKSKSTYSYVTSVTNNQNNKKAKVYKSKYSSIDKTVKDIIDGVPEGITKTIDMDETTDEDGIGLETKNEYAYIYEEDGDIYVQVSDKKYVSSSGSTYHSSHRHYYYRTYSSNRKSTTYSNYASSARQSSINSRTSSGGGTSSGK